MIVFQTNMSMKKVVSDKLLQKFLKNTRNNDNADENCQNSQNVTGDNQFYLLRTKIVCFLNQCNHCICHLKTKFVLIHQRRSKHVENIILAIIACNTSKENLF